MKKICSYQPTSCELIDGNPTIRINYYSRDEDDQQVIEKVIIITTVMTGGTAYLKVGKEGCWDYTLGPIVDWDIDKDTFEELGKDMSLQLLRGYLAFTVGKYNSDHLPTDGFTTIGIYEPLGTKLSTTYESFCQMMYDAIMAR